MKKAFFSFLFLLSILPNGSIAYAQPFDPVEGSCDELTATQRLNSEFCNEARTATEDPITGAEGVILTVANVLSIVAGIIAVIILIVAGITMTTSGGESQKVQNSRNAIIYTIVGVVVIVLARSIIIFVINQVG